MATALMFAGQGAEEPDMALGLPPTDPFLAAARAATGLDVARALARGARDLARTSILQPAMTAVQLAHAQGARAEWVGGHSLGELTAACWAAELSPEEAVGLAAARGQAMERAAAARPGGMMAVRGSPLDDATLARVRERGALDLAAVNAPGETVYAGDEAALAALAEELGPRAARLRVSGPWHGRAMREAAEALRPALRDAFAGRALRARLLSTHAARELAPAEVADQLADGIAGPLRFAESIALLRAAGVDRAVLPRPARVLRSLIRRAGARSWALEAG